ncbi:type I methionyl aminopeptidase [Ureaplasma zalophigenitalium]|uniref:Methionine aminopeptidase n=1 Tax=Ureaplasma zalophigenitalium TaxID=907723 RepID=A0ABT3BNT4_9BACT|nr:type I methionyl aminopeptidase [Ureaplasma zalophigenitalium]MCV3753894.1 type I methionyl aminopeptidase [Ureaplasma zalophigenitalium]
MQIYIKTPEDIQNIKEAINIWKKAKQAILDNVRVGISLLELDAIANQAIVQANGVSAFKDYLGFKHHICISVNECVIHGVPTNYTLKSGDKVTFDMGVKYNERYCDAAFTVIVDNANVQAQKISDVCLLAIYEAVKMIKPGVTNFDVARTINKFVRQHGYYLLEDFTGHGCGVQIHEEPAMPNYVNYMQFREEKLEENMVLCLEPMIMTKSKEYYIDPLDQWSVKAKNKLLTAHWEHMVLVTKDGCEILTLDD